VIEEIFNRSYSNCGIKEGIADISFMLSLVKMYGSVIPVIAVASCNIRFIASDYAIFSFQVEILHFFLS
jgi:hypothetical protein